MSKNGQYRLSKFSPGKFCKNCVSMTSFSTKFVIKRILGKNLLNSASRISGADGNETKIVSLKRLFRKLIFGNKIGLTE